MLRTVVFITILVYWSKATPPMNITFCSNSGCNENCKTQNVPAFVAPCYQSGNQGISFACFNNTLFTVTLWNSKNCSKGYVAYEFAKTNNCIQMTGGRSYWVQCDVAYSKKQNFNKKQRVICFDKKGYDMAHYMRKTVPSKTNPKNGYVCPQFPRYADENIECLKRCYRDQRLCCYCDRHFLYQMQFCGMSCPNNQYVCMQERLVDQPTPNENCFPTNPGSRTTSFEWSISFWKGFASQCYQGYLKDTCGGRLALAGSTFINDITNLHRAWNSNEMNKNLTVIRLHDHVLPEACDHFKGPVARVFNVLHATATLTDDITNIVSSCGGRIVGIIGNIIRILANVDKALCGIVNHYVAMEQEWIATMNSWFNCVRNPVHILPPEHDLCFEAGKHFAAYVKEYFDGAVC